MCFNIIGVRTLGKYVHENSNSLAQTKTSSYLCIHTVTSACLLKESRACAQKPLDHVFPYCMIYDISFIQL